MVLTITTICAAVLLAVILAKCTKDRREMERYSITPEALHALLASNRELLVIDARLPLDLLGESVIIPGALRSGRIRRSFLKRKIWSCTVPARVI
jgi:hypothetical protein